MSRAQSFWWAVTSTRKERQRALDDRAEHNRLAVERREARDRHKAALAEARAADADDVNAQNLIARERPAR